MNQVKQNGKRIPYIDALKGLAILCVVLGHVANGQLMDPFTQTAYFFVYNIIHTFHMVLFVLLSGEVFYHAYCKETSKGAVSEWFLRKRSIHRLAGQIFF